ncbi:MAG: glycosyltransferase family 4 protein [Acidimicrobiia bacterium]|nr:glycosyltransferase family 4 protein [Acidimicrobiia bacterium]
MSRARPCTLLEWAAGLVCGSLHEGFGSTPPEAVARGCPVVAAPRGAIPELCGDAAVYALPDRRDGRSGRVTEPPVVQEVKRLPNGLVVLHDEHVIRAHRDEVCHP